jgi:uncharacterized protein (DUF1501 family)
MSKYINRRSFIGQASCAAVGSTALLSTLSNFMLTNAALADTAANFNDYKALICFFLPGGNDSYNMLVPTGSAYQQYADARSDLALPQASLLPISPLNNVGRPLGLHPGMAGIKSLFDAQHLSFISNIGSLVRPTTLDDFNNGKSLPYGISSHSDQQEQWQTSVPDVRSGIGWGGRAADLLVSANQSSNVSMNISISGNNLYQVGNNVIPYTVNSNGAAALQNYDGTDGFNPLRKKAINSQINQSYSNVFEKTYMNVKRNSLDAYYQFNAATSAPLPPDTLTGDLGNSLREIAKIINGRTGLGVKRQIFYLQWGGWDFHDNVIKNMDAMMPVISNAMKSFFDLLTAMGVQNNVTLFQASEFGRSLTSNAAGSDHAWGGNTFVMGGAVNGGRVLGTYPDLIVGGNLDFGRGCLLPTTSVDQLAAELALWMGVPKSELPLVLPNIANFYNLSGTDLPLGLMG